MSIADELVKLENGKQSVVNAVNSKAGTSLANTCTWASLASAVNNISTNTVKTFSITSTNKTLSFSTPISVCAMKVTSVNLSGASGDWYCTVGFTGGDWDAPDGISLSAITTGITYLIWEGGLWSSTGVLEYVSGDKINNIYMDISLKTGNYINIEYVTI